MRLQLEKLSLELRGTWKVPYSSPLISPPLGSFRAQAHIMPGRFTGANPLASPPVGHFPPLGSASHLGGLSEIPDPPPLFPDLLKARLADERTPAGPVTQFLDELVDSLGNPPGKGNCRIFTSLPSQGATLKDSNLNDCQCHLYLELSVTIIPNPVTDNIYINHKKHQAVLKFNLFSVAWNGLTEELEDWSLSRLSYPVPTKIFYS